MQLVPKNIKIIFEGKTNCRLHRKLLKVYNRTNFGCHGSRPCLQPWVKVSPGLVSSGQPMTLVFLACYNDLTVRYVPWVIPVCDVSSFSQFCYWRKPFLAARILWHVVHLLHILCFLLLCFIIKGDCIIRESFSGLQCQTHYDSASQLIYPWGELSMGRVVHGASCPWGELSMGRAVHGASCPWGELSMGRAVHGASCPWGKLSMGQAVHGASSPRG
jgi:hypothetical protein